MRFWKLSEWRRVLAAIRSWSPDIVHIQYPTQGYRSPFLPSMTPLLSTVAGRAVVRTWHEVHALRGAPFFFLEALPPGPIVAVRPQLYDQLPRLFQATLNPQRVRFIPNASSIPKQDLSTSERARIRTLYLRGQQRLILFFGFVYPFKGVEQIFEIANPATDHLMIAGEEGGDEEYVARLRSLADAAPWTGKVTFTGFLSADESGRLIAASDAVVLPFRHGAGVWNSSIHAAVLQGTPVITTTDDNPHFDAARHVHFAAVDDIAAMRDALDRLAGHRRPYSPLVDVDEWEMIARQHLELYGELLGRGFPGGVAS